MGSGAVLPVRGRIRCRVVSVLVTMIFVRHQADEDRREEHEHEGLQQRDKDFEQRDQHPADRADNGHCTHSKPTEPRLRGECAEGCEHNEQYVPCHHVGKQANGQS